MTMSSDAHDPTLADLEHSDTNANDRESTSNSDHAGDGLTAADLVVQNAVLAFLEGRGASSIDSN